MCVEDEMEEAALCENNKIYHLSDEDDVTQAAIIPEPTKSVLPSLVADYKDDTDNGRYLIYTHTRYLAFISTKKHKTNFIFRCHRR